MEREILKWTEKISCRGRPPLMNRRIHDITECTSLYHRLVPLRHLHALLGGGCELEGVKNSFCVAFIYIVG